MLPWFRAAMVVVDMKTSTKRVRARGTAGTGCLDEALGVGEGGGWLFDMEVVYWIGVRTPQGGLGGGGASRMRDEERAS